MNRSEPVVAITHRFEFSAAHRLHSPSLTDEENRRLYGPCNNRHGHNYECEVTVEGPVASETGMVMNLAHLAELLDEHIFQVVDHKDLNEDVPFLAEAIPTAEVLAVRFWEQLEPHLRTFERCRLRRIRIFESRKNRVEYHGPDPGPSAS